MKLKLFACLFVLVGGFVCVSQAQAISKIGNPFLSVDINGQAGGTPAVGPLQSGYQPLEVLVQSDSLDGNFTNPGNWSRAQTVGISKTFATSEGNITAKITGFSPVGNAGYSARNRLNEDPPNVVVPPNPLLLSLERDFIFAGAADGVGWGRSYIKTELTGLIPNQTYLLSTWARDINFNAATNILGYAAWTDLAALGGLDGPAAWLDANTGTTGLAVGAGYDSVEVAPTGVYKNPIPTKWRSRNTGPNFISNPFAYAATFKTTADGTGKVTFYTWPDGDSFTGTGSAAVQRAAVLNGFEVAKVPEPASVVLFVVGLAGLIGLRRRYC